MDKMTKYRELIERHLSELAAYANRSPNDEVETQCVFDEAHDQYLLVNVGWANRRRIRAITLHVHRHRAGSRERSARGHCTCVSPARIAALDRICACVSQFPSLCGVSAHDPYAVRAREELIAEGVFPRRG
jgi:hypothetical protein